MNNPFFARFLENQQNINPAQAEEVKGGQAIIIGPPYQTNKWPSDNDG